MNWAFSTRVAFPPRLALEHLPPLALCFLSRWLRETCRPLRVSGRLLCAREGRRFLADLQVSRVSRVQSCDEARPGQARGRLDSCSGMVFCVARCERVTSSETEWLITSHSLRNLLSSSLLQDMDLYVYINMCMRRERGKRRRIETISFEILSGISIGRQLVKREKFEGK